ncbi:MAG: hypothetical protein U1E59_16325 [Amaricoccus sp.]
MRPQRIASRGLLRPDRGHQRLDPGRSRTMAGTPDARGARF